MEHFDVIGTPFSVCFGATEHYTGNRFLFLYLRNYRLHNIFYTIILKT